PASRPATSSGWTRSPGSATTPTPTRPGPSPRRPSSSSSPGSPTPTWPASPTRTPCACSTTTPSATGPGNAARSAPCGPRPRRPTGTARPARPARPDRDPASAGSMHQLAGTLLGRWYVTLFGLTFAWRAGRHLGWRRTLLYAVAATAVGMAAENGSVHLGFPYTHYRFNPALRHRA